MKEDTCIIRRRRNRIDGKGTISRGSNPGGRTISFFKKREFLKDIPLRKIAGMRDVLIHELREIEV
jgi:hypothetical protein